MQMTGWMKTQDGLEITTDRGRMRVHPSAANILRITYTLEDSFGSRQSLMLCGKPSRYGEWSVAETDEAVCLTTTELTMRVDKGTVAFSYFDNKGRLLTREPRRGGKTLEPVEVVKAVFDNEVSVRAEMSVDGIRQRTADARQVVDRTAYHTKLAFEFQPGEALYGLGSHEEGVMNLRGTHQYLYQQNLKVSVPMLVSTRGWGVLMDSCSLMIFRDDMHGSYLWTDVDDALDYYFIFGPELDRIVEGSRALTGKAPLLPKWAYGYIQSKERYKTADELVEVVEEYRKRNIPLDCVVLDWRSWAGELWGQKSLDPERFPDPDGMTDRLHRLNAKLMVSIWPIMREGDGATNHAEMKAAGLLLGDRATYDAFNPAARALYWKQANEGLFSHGVDAWWCDCTEPFESDWKGEVKPEPEERMRINSAEARLYLDPEYSNAYSLVHSQGIYEGQRSASVEKRVVNLTRSAYAGQQRYATVTWSGDISANWETLRRQIPAGLNFCAAGLPYWTLDIGAFFVGRLASWRRWCGNDQAPPVWFWDGDYDDGCEDLGYRELYTRWLQLGAFLPMFRSHGTDTPREVWRFGEPGTVFYDAIVLFIQLRYRLMPYIYSVAAMVALQDYTMLRPLAFDFRQDSAVYDISDQFMFGPSIMVCPVTIPMYYESGSKPLSGIPKSRKVYLPAGSLWFDFWTGQSYEGGQTINAEADISTMPLFVRSGSILPLAPVAQHTAAQAGLPMELRVYGGGDGSFTLYEDEGDSYRYELGQCASTTMQWQEQSGMLRLMTRQGCYPGMPEFTTMQVVKVSPGVGEGLEPETKNTATKEYRGTEMMIQP